MLLKNGPVAPFFTLMEDKRELSVNSFSIAGDVQSSCSS